jgi:hypothetical protein
MQQWRLVATEKVVQAHASELRQPVALSLTSLAIDAVVGDECARVDRSARPIKGVGSSLGEIARNDVGTDHGRIVAHMCRHAHYTALGQALQGRKPSEKPA